MASGIGKLRQTAEHNGQAMYGQVQIVTRAEGTEYLAEGKLGKIKTTLPG